MPAQQVNRGANAQLYVTEGPKPAQPFDGTHDAEVLYKAMKGLGTDDKVLSNILAERTRDQLQEIKKAFETHYKKTLASWIKGETSGHYETLCLALIEDRAEYDADILNHSIKGLGTNDDELIEVVCTRTNGELKAMKDAYRRMHKVDAEKDVSGDTSGHYKDLLIAVLKADRPEGQAVDIEAAKRDAKFLYDQGEGKLGTNEKAFIDILTQRSFPQLHTIADCYASIAGHTLEKGIAKEMSGNFKKALTVLMTPKEEFFAEQFRHAVAGAGTDDRKLIRNVSYVSNSKPLFQAVNGFYMHKYKNNLANDVGGDTSGWYHKTIVHVITNRVNL